MKSSFYSNVDLNTFILDFAVSIIIFANALVDMKNRKEEKDPCGNYIVIPDSFLLLDKSSSLTDPSMLESSTEIKNRNSLLKQYLLYSAGLVLYFVLMVLFGIAGNHVAGAVLLVQHLCFSIVIFIAMRKWIKSRLFSVLLALAFCVFWLKSLNTSYRWIVNNTIVLLVAAMTRYVKFRNFISLQIFMWLAFFYDVFALSKLPSAITSRFFSLATPCKTLLCDISLHNIRYDLPTVFSVQIGPSTKHVYLGAGDIIIGAFVANFTAAFFHSRKHLAFNVCLYALAILVLMSVTSSQSPALLTIVPFGTIGIFASAFFTRSIKRLFNLG